MVSGWEGGRVGGWEGGKLGPALEENFFPYSIAL